MRLRVASLTGHARGITSGCDASGESAGPTAAGRSGPPSKTGADREASLASGHAMVVHRTIAYGANEMPAIKRKAA